MKVIDTGKIVVESPLDGKLAARALAGARLVERTESECRDMRAAAQAKAAEIIADAQHKADEIRERLRKFEDAVRPIAKSIVDAWAVFQCRANACRTSWKARN
jgi:cell division septum initiation protein DivIVA